MGKRRIKQQRTKIVRVDLGSEGESNTPYWEHVRLNGREQEDPLANPDVLSDEPEHKLWRSERYTDLENETLDMLRNKDLSDILTKDEYEILKLIVNEGKTHREVMDATGMPERTLFDRLSSARKKLRKYLELED